MQLSKLHFYLVFFFLIIYRPLYAQPIFINEFHYDNAGADVGEFVELSGVAGINLDGWTLAFYNGTNGKVYANWQLSGQIPDQSNSFGSLAFTNQKMLQNGGSDGIALIDNLGALVQFISYEGQVTATNGAANGHTSTDVGVFEDGSTEVGYSLQLVGSGKIAEDFTWQGAVSSMGLVNNDQYFSGPTISTASLPSVQTVISVPEPSVFMMILVSLLLCGVHRIDHQFIFKRRIYSA